MQIPHQVEYIIDKLNRHGYEAYAVGGCVRDTLMGRTPGDWDITTSARPQQVKQLFRRTVDTGIEHGTVTVLVEHTGYEVTTYRVDGEYEDGRHPRQVAFTASLEEDLKRRDFTINAMAYSHRTGIVDIFDGMGDLERRIIRCVGDPMERFSEDALRILRAIRFCAQLDFAIEPGTFDAIRRMAPRISLVSRERIQMELTRLLLSEHPERVRLVFETGMSPYISETLARLPWREISVPARLPARKYVRWAAFLRLLPAEEAALVLRELKMDNDTVRKVRTLVAASGAGLPPEETQVRRAMSGMEPEVWDMLLELNGYGTEIYDLTRRIRERGDCLDLGHLAVKGKDLIDAGVAPGKQIGVYLEQMLEHVLAHPEDNQKEILLAGLQGLCYNPLEL